MDNKLQELTKKLYDEGLSKGKQESEQLIGDAKTEAENIIGAAKKEAEDILTNAAHSAEDMKRNSMTEVSLAAREVIAKLKQHIEDMIIMKGVAPGVTEANADPEFIKGILMEIAKNWNGGSSAKMDLSVLLPDGQKEKFTKIVEGAAAKNLNEGLEINFDKKIKSGFTIGPKDGGYYISFTDEAFVALLKGYLRPQIAEVLFSGK